MKILSNTFNRQNLGLMILGVALFGACAASEAKAQQRDDPFRKPVVAVPRSRKAGAKAEKLKAAAPAPVAAPAIQARIDSYKIVRQRCAELGVACPKPTSVLTLDEMQVVGIFRTPRGPAAMIEATPIKLSYTIYPGEKFYDGQLVAVEEGKLTFRRTVQMSNGKEIMSVDSKTLRQATINDMSAARAESTAPTTTTTAPATTTAAPATTGISAAAVPMNEATNSAKTNEATDAAKTNASDAAKINAPAMRVDPPTKLNVVKGDDNVNIKLGDEAETVAPVKAKKSSSKAKNKR